MPTIDFHNHYYPPEYIKAIEQGPSAVRITHDPAGNPCLHYPGDYNVAVPGHRDIDYREQVLRSSGVDTQVITLTTPGTHIEAATTAIRLARLVNDAFARIVEKSLAVAPRCGMSLAVRGLGGIQLLLGTPPPHTPLCRILADTQIEPKNTAHPPCVVFHPA